MKPWAEFWGLFLQVWVWIGAIALVMFGLVALMAVASRGIDRWFE